MLARLYEMLLIHAIRSYAPNGDEAQAGWLAGIADRRLGPTLRAMHADLQRPWTVESLARQAGMSRSAFAARFKAWSASRRWTISLGGGA